MVINAVSWIHCSHVLTELNRDQRQALKAVANGFPVTVATTEFGSLKALGLIQHDGRGVRLTDNGRAVASFC